MLSTKTLFPTEEIPIDVDIEMHNFFSDKRHIYQGLDNFLLKKKEDIRDLENEYNGNLVGFFGWFLIFLEESKRLNIPKKEIFNFLEKIWFGFLALDENFQDFSIDKNFESPSSLKLLQSLGITSRTDFLYVVPKVIENFYGKTNKEKKRIFQELSIPKKEISSFISLFQNNPEDWGHGLDKLDEAYGNGYLFRFLYAHKFFTQKDL